MHPRTARTALATLSLLTLACGATAQAKWTKLSPAASPAARGSASSTADLVAMYVFGGNQSATLYFNDLWSFNGTTWRELSKQGATGAPVARRWGAIAYDHARGQVVVHGGQDASGNNLGDTWTWDGTKWTQHTVAVTPGIRRWHAMAYDWANGQVLLFGGYDGTNVLADTWAWNGKAWNKLAPQNAPSKRGRLSLASRQATKDIVLYGGAANSGNPWGTLGDMWTWNGSDWSQVQTNNAPYTIGVMTHPLVWDELRERLVVFGGYNGYERGDTWEFANGTWTQRTFTTQPIARSRPSMEYLPVFRKSVMFGGYAGPTPAQQGDTWEYQTDAVAAVTNAGTGCAGDGGVPTLASSLPWLDGDLTMQLGNIGTGARPMLVIGLSKAVWTGGSLPFNLGVIGFPKCDLLVSMDLLVGGVSTLSTKVPNTATLIGQQVYFQAASLGSTLGVSPRLELRIGAR